VALPGVSVGVSVNTWPHNCEEWSKLWLHARGQEFGSGNRYQDSEIDGAIQSPSGQRVSRTVALLLRFEFPTSDSFLVFAPVATLEVFVVAPGPGPGGVNETSSPAVSTMTAVIA
jgi:hypothetical protein